MNLTQHRLFIKAKSKGGRPIKLTPEVQQTIVSYIRSGNYVETSAAAAGITKETFYSWLRSGANAKSGIFKEFSDAVKRAMAEAESRDLAEKHAYSFQDKPISIVLTFDRHPHLVVANMEPLPDGYAKAAQAVAEKRVALAGHRLANQLKAILP